MQIFGKMARGQYEQLVFCHEPQSGLKAIICIHDTTLGPGLGGTRMWPYEHEEDAIQDALRLARGMTYKNAAAGLNLGGAKAVIIGDPAKDKSEALWRAFGRFVQTLGGRYITAEDVGTSPADMEFIHMETNSVVGLKSRGSSGDPSPLTALGVYRGMLACAKEVWGQESLRGKTVAVQGLGHVGAALCDILHKEGCKLVVSDVQEKRVQAVVEKIGAQAVAAEVIYDVDCDIFAPCALGGVLNERTIERLRCRVVAGAANNQLQEAHHGDLLQQKGILYAPDFIINAGGVINVYDELQPGGYHRDRATRRVETIYENMGRVLAMARKEKLPPHKAAERVAEERLRQMRNLLKLRC